jgi:hypothetical protein
MEQTDLAASVLRVRRKRPSRRGAPDQHDELASPHIGSQAQTTALHPLKQVLR